MFKTSKAKDRKKLLGKIFLNKESLPGTPETPDHSPDPASCPTMSPAKPRLKRSGQVCFRMLSSSSHVPSWAQTITTVVNMVMTMILGNNDNDNVRRYAQTEEEWSF